MTAAQDPLPVTVIGGYLGSGKTTLVNHLLRHADGMRLAVLVNEFGELPIDEDLIEAEDDTLISIAGGCVCCSFGSDLTGALLDMARMQPRPDHLLIESSGVAIPSAIVGSVSLLDGFRADGIVILADGENLRRSAADKYMGDTVLRQIADANIIILNKADLVSAAALADTRAWLAGHKPDVRIIETTQGTVPPGAVLDSFLTPNAAPGPHHDTANLEMLTLALSGPIDVDQLATALTRDDMGIIRAKGFVTARSGQKTLIQVVGTRCQISDAPADKEDGVVCLGIKGVLSCDALHQLAQTV